MLESVDSQSIVSQIKVRNEAHGVLEHVAELFCTLSSDLNFVLVAVVVGQADRGQCWMGDQRAEKRDSALCVDVVATKA